MEKKWNCSETKLKIKLLKPNKHKTQTENPLQFNLFAFEIVNSIVNSENVIQLLPFLNFKVPCSRVKIQ